MKKATNILLLFATAACFIAIMGITWNRSEFILAGLGVLILTVLITLKR